jgi:hypothetical protein
LTYLDYAETRVCFYIHRRIDPKTWTIKYISKDIISLEITGPDPHNKIRIFNIYNEVGTTTVADLAEAISKLDTHEGLLVLGDFNLHYPL